MNRMPAVLPNWTTVAFTGHRKLADPARIAAAMREALADLESRGRPLVAITTAASGADTLLLEVLAARSTPFYLVLPFPEVRFREDFLPEEWARAHRHFDRALSIDVVRDVDTDNEAYLEAGVRGVDEADVLLAVWNGQPAAGQGGAGDVVTYARELDKPLVHIDAATGAISTERLDRLPPSDPDAPRGMDPAVAPRELVHRQYEAFDSVAERHAPTTRRLIVRVVWLHLIATAVGVTGSALNWPGAAGQSFTLFKLGALGLALYLSSRQRTAHHEWRGARLAAECCRSYLALWPLRRRGARLHSLALEDEADLIRSLQIAWLSDRGEERPLAEARDAYIEGRIQDQLRYFRSKYKSDGDRAARLKRLSLVATGAAFACSLAVLGMSWREPSGPALTITKWASNLLGLIPPAILTFVIGLDLSRRAERFGETTAKLERAEKQLRLASTWPSVWREVAAVESFLLREVVEWYSQMRPRKRG
jgi:hypothetical protein